MVEDEQVVVEEEEGETEKEKDNHHPTTPTTITTGGPAMTWAMFAIGWLNQGTNATKSRNYFSRYVHACVQPSAYTCHLAGRRTFVVFTVCLSLTDG